MGVMHPEGKRDRNALLVLHSDEMRLNAFRRLLLEAGDPRTPSGRDRLIHLNFRDSTALRASTSEVAKARLAIVENGLGLWSRGGCDILEAAPEVAGVLWSRGTVGPAAPLLRLLVRGPAGYALDDRPALLAAREFLRLRRAGRLPATAGALARRLSAPAVYARADWRLVVRGLIALGRVRRYGVSSEGNGCRSGANPVAVLASWREARVATTDLAATAREAGWPGWRLLKQGLHALLPVDADLDLLDERQPFGGGVCKRWSDRLRETFPGTAYLRGREPGQLWKDCLGMYLSAGAQFMKWLDTEAAGEVVPA